MNWTQPICVPCFAKRNPHGKQPYRVIEADPERCCDCGQPHQSGIYIRVDPRTVPFPVISGGPGPSEAA